MGLGGVDYVGVCYLCLSVCGEHLGDNFECLKRLEYYGELVLGMNGVGLGVGGWGLDVNWIWTG